MATGVKVLAKSIGIGPGSEKIKGWKHNTELFTIMKEAYGF
jgi:alkaline phosphatase